MSQNFANGSILTLALRQGAGYQYGVSSGELVQSSAEGATAPVNSQANEPFWL
jgi:hypothetical protein